jgi:4-amino-4-deoxychorismate lyase
MNNIWLVDGKAERQIDVADRGLTYGDGLFETIAVRDSRCRFLPEHLQRLARGCRQLGIPDQDLALLTDEAEMLASGINHGVLKIIVTRGIGRRGYKPPTPPVPTRIVGVEQTDAANNSHCQTGIRARLCKTRLGSNPALAGVKTLNRLENVLARAEWNDVSISEGLLCNQDGHLICGTMSNLFLIKGGAVKTPDLTECGITGIMREQITQCCGAADIPLEICQLTLEDAQHADELFVCNSSFGIWPIIQLDNYNLEIGPVTRALITALSELGVAECKL